MRFQIGYTREPELARYPDGTVAGEERIRWDEQQVSEWKWKDDEKQRAAWLKIGNAFDEDGVAVTVNRGHFIEITTIEQLLAIQEEFGDLIIGGSARFGHSIEIYNDYCE